MFPDLTLFYMSIYGGFGFSGAACFAYLELATGRTQAGNPAYTIADFLAMYPKFSGPATPTAAVLNSTTAVLVPDSTGMEQGDVVMGSGIQGGTVIMELVTAPVAFTGDLTEGANGVLNVSSTAGLMIGQPISGLGIAPCTTIAAIGTDTLQLSKNAIADGTTVALTATSSTLTLSLPATLTGDVTLYVYEAAPVAPAVIQVFLNLANASLMSSRWRETWPVAMGWYIAHFLTLYLQSDGIVSTSPGQIANSGLQRGLLVSKSADGLSAGFQSLTGLDSWGSWQLTSYGVQLATFARVLGAGATYIR